MIPQSSRPVHVEVSPVHQRTSRRLLGLPAECGLLPDRATKKIVGNTATVNTNMTDAPLQYVVQQPRTPKVFYGEPYEDVEDWLDHFERVATFNGWDNNHKRRQVYYSLEEGARTWFENHESTLSSWEEFRQRLLATFMSSDRKEKAEAALQARNQRQNESVTMYTEDMVRLCRRADPAMTDEKKVRHLMRGVKQDIFAGLMRNPPRTVAEFVSEATTIEGALQRRAKRYCLTEAMVSNASCMTGLENCLDLRELVRKIVREELQAFRQQQSSAPTVSIAEMIREEVRQAVGIPEPTEEPQLEEPKFSYAAALQQYHHRSPPTVATPAPTPPLNPRPRRSLPYPPETQPRKSDLWRTPDRRPLCFHCGEEGHVYRACPYRRIGLRGFAPNAPRPRNGERPQEIEYYLADRRNVFAPRRPESRSPSPMQRRSSSPRFAPSSSDRPSRSFEIRGN
ncbi:uncharacterized protein LOC144148561 [Haemaphysalis longicornis]